MGGLIVPGQAIRDRIKELEERVNDLEQKCRHYERQFVMLIHQVAKDCNMIQRHEVKLSQVRPSDAPGSTNLK